MKLIRIHSEDKNGYLETTFNQDITIEPNSKIALSNAIFTGSNSEFEFTTDNNIITIQLTGDQPAEVLTIPPQTITKSTFGDFLENTLTTLANDSLHFTGKRIGGQFRIQLGELRGEGYDGYVSFIFLRSFLTDGLEYGDDENNYIIDDNMEWTANRTGNGDRRFYSTEPATTELNQKALVSGTAVCKGGGVIRCTLDTLTDNGDGTAEGILTSSNGFFIGSILYNDHVEEIEQADLILGVYAEYQGLNYKLIVNGIESDTGIPINNPDPLFSVQDNDCIEVVKSRGEWFVHIYQIGVGKQLLHKEKAEDLPDDMFPAVIMKGNEAHTKFRQLRFTIDPYEYNYYDIDPTYKENDYRGTDPYGNEGFDLLERYSLGDNPTKLFTSARTRQLTSTQITFNNFNTANYFGFNSTVLPLEPTLRSLWIIVGTNPYNPAIANNNYIIELLNMDIESYDSLAKGHRNILKVIHQTNVGADKNLINYEANNLTFLNIRNATKQTLRNIKVRILNAYLKPINTTGLSAITILIDN